MAEGSFHFWRRFKLFSGLWLNLSKSGISFSIGTPGAKITTGLKKGKTVSLGIPGTGLFFRKKLDKD